MHNHFENRLVIIYFELTRYLRVGKETQLNITHLTFPAQSFEEVIRLEFALLVGHDARHLEDEPLLGRVVQADGVELEHAQRRRVAHRVHY